VPFRTIVINNVQKTIDADLFYDQNVNVFYIGTYSKINSFRTNVKSRIDTGLIVYKR
jgi:hypothetical protein